MTTSNRYEIPRRNVTTSDAQRDGCTVRTVHEDGAFLCWTLFNPSGWRVGDYKTERGLTRAIARVTGNEHVSTEGAECPACIPSGLTFADLPIGTRVRIAHRQGATGTVDSHFPGSGTVGIRFDGSRPGFGLNYPQQCEVI